MGDRCDGYLEVSGRVSRKDYDDFVELILCEGGELCGDGEPCDQRNFFLPACNYGAVPEAILQQLEALKLSYVWTTGAGDGYGPMIEFRDGGTGQRASFGMIDAEIALTLGQACDEAAVALAVFWHDWGHQQKLEIID